MRGRTGGQVPHFIRATMPRWENCEANRREGEEYLRMVLEEAGDDAGRRGGSRDRAGLCAPKFAFVRHCRLQDSTVGELSTTAASIPGSEYERLSVATFATHDHKPLRALWEEAFEQENATRQRPGRHDLAKIAEFAGIAAPNETDDYRAQIFTRRFSRRSFAANPGSPSS